MQSRLYSWGLLEAVFLAAGRFSDFMTFFFLAGPACPDCGSLPALPAASRRRQVRETSFFSCLQEAAVATGQLPSIGRFELKQVGAVEGLHAPERSPHGMQQFNRAAAGVILRSCTGRGVAGWRS